MTVIGQIDKVGGTGQFPICLVAKNCIIAGLKDTRIMFEFSLNRNDENSMTSVAVAKVVSLVLPKKP